MQAYRSDGKNHKCSCVPPKTGKLRLAWAWLTGRLKRVNARAGACRSWPAPACCAQTDEECTCGTQLCKSWRGAGRFGLAPHEEAGDAAARPFLAAAQELCGYDDYLDYYNARFCDVCQCHSPCV